MPLNFNSVTLAGTLTRDPEIKRTPGGKSVCGFSLAVNESWKDDRGEKHENVSFFEIEAWGKTADTIEKWCKKGHCIMIEGKLKQDSWTDKETDKKRSKVKVLCERMHFVSKPKGEGDSEYDQRQESRPSKPSASRTATPSRPPVSQGDDESDDIPF